MKNLKLNLMVILLMIFNLSLWFASDCEAAFAVKGWEYYKDINIENAQVGKNYRIVLDKDIYNVSQVSLNDLRIILNKEIELPYEIFTFKAHSNIRNMVSEILDNSVTQEKANIVILDLGEAGQKNNKLYLEIDEHNFGRRVMVEGGDDTLNWQLLTRDSYIYDFTFGGEAFPRGGEVKWQRAVDSKYMVDFSYRTASRSTEVRYKENKFQYLKITVFGSEDEEPLTIKGVNISSHYIIPADETEYTCLIKEAIINKEQRSSEITLDFGVKNIHLHNLKINSNSKNYYRTLFIQGSNDLEEWVRVGSGEIFDYNIENFKDSKRDISFHESRYRYLKLIILNQDNPPINIDSVIGVGLNRSIVFPYQAEGNLRIYYGNPFANKPSYDYTRYVRRANVRELETLLISQEFKNPSYVLKKIKRPWTEEKPYILWIALIAIVIILLFLVASMLKKIK